MTEIVLVVDGHSLRNPWPGLTTAEEVATRAMHCIDTPGIAGQICRLRGSGEYLVVNWNTVRTVLVRTIG